MKGPSPLSQSNVQPSNEQNTTDDRGARLLRMLPMLLINIVVPLLVNMLAQHYMSIIQALLLACVVPTLFTLGGFLVKKRIDVVGVISVAGLLLSAAFALLFKSPRLLLIQTSSILGVFGVVLLISLLFPRPALWYLARSVLGHNDPHRFASFHTGWSSLPQYRSFYRTLTAAWGCVTVANLLLLLALTFTLPISVMLVLSNIVGYVVILPLIYWSIRFYRKNKPMFDYLRQQR